MELLEKVKNDPELMDIKRRLESVPDSYKNFVYAGLMNCICDPAFKERLVKFMDNNPDAITDDIVENVEY